MSALDPKVAEQHHRKTRIVSVVAATAISLACGTNYAYSAWAPQFAEKLHLSATQSNVIGTAANFGMYAAGIPLGMITDLKGPRISAALGTIALAVGFFPIHTAFDKGPSSMSVPLISFCSFLTGVGSCAAFQGALKTATLNWPAHRGTATSFPLAAFGLSAVFYTVIAGIAFPGNTSGYLMLLSLGTSLLVLVCIPFLRIVDHVPHTSYAALPSSEPRLRRDSNVLRRTKSGGVARYSSAGLEGGEITPSSSAPAQHQQEIEDNDSHSIDTDENSSLLSSAPGDIAPPPDPEPHSASSSAHSHRKIDVTGLALLPRREFWELWVLMGLLTGVGLMTINNIGHDVQALWLHWDDSVSKDFIASQQLLHVSLISLGSFAGRLLSGIGSDFLVKKLNASRFWCATASALLFTTAQISALKIQNPSNLIFLSTLTGLAYGALFGVYPTLVADAFGPKGFAVNWGFMTLAPVVSGNVYNLCYGAIYDKQSVVGDGGERVCGVGRGCYEGAYWITLGSSVAGVVATVWCVREERARKRRLQEEGVGFRVA